MMKANAIKLPFKFDAQRIQKELETISESFQPILSAQIEDNKLIGMHLITASLNGEQNSKGYTYCMTKELERCPYLQSVLNTFECDKFMFRTQNLKPGGKIEMHRDRGRGLIDGIVRLNIPVTTNNEVYFHINGERILMENGECWLPNVTESHEVENRSESLRMQLMIDCDLNDWWKAILKEEGVVFSEPGAYKTYSMQQLQQMKDSILAMDDVSTMKIISEIDIEISTRI